MKSVLGNPTEAVQEENVTRTVKNSITNPFDLYALETALSLPTEKEISVFTMGEQASGSALLTEACKLGANKLFLITDRAFSGSDTYVTAKILSRALTMQGPFDLILCGERAVDGETGQVPGELSAMLGIPYATCVVRLDQEEAGAFLCQCKTEDSLDTVSVPLPAVLGISCGMEGIIHPVVPSLRSLQNARRIQIQYLDHSILGLPKHEVGLTGSKTRVVKTRRPRWRRECRILRDADAGAEAVLRLIREDSNGRCL